MGSCESCRHLNEFKPNIFFLKLMVMYPVWLGNTGIYQTKNWSKIIFDHFDFIILIITGPIGLVNLLTAKACGASKVAITGVHCS